MCSFLSFLASKKPYEMYRTIDNLEWTKHECGHEYNM